MKVELVCVGTELLLGNILNTNAKYLSEKCAELGLSLYYQTVVGDNDSRLAEMIKAAFERSDVVIFTGGLGPTSDDITKEVVSETFDLPLIYDEKAADDLTKRLNRFGVTVTDNNYKQAYVPDGCTVLYNHNGTAPGILIEKNGKIAILLPGPPKEMQPMFEEYCVPFFKECSCLEIDSVMVKLIGIGESSAASKIEDIIAKSTNPTVAPYAKQSQVHLRITARAESSEACRALIDPVLAEIKARLGEYIYTTEAEKDIEDVVYDLLKEKHLTITTAESCTGGLLAGKIINVSGASDVYKEGFVTYSDEAKMKDLGVSKETLDQYSAVSSQCAEEMARGAAKAAGADVAVVTTGIAGPEGGSEENPVGTVYIGVFYGGKTVVKRYSFGNNRQMVRDAACVRALDMVRRTII
ncbi:MAG: competence/damage-inducible protein A [Lachnospiraceae bacterium]|nr:competence/damage-inducible protein A [Lachnospiraceae bacterium]